MNNQTSSVKVFESRNTSYKLGDLLEFKIPPSILAINSLETYFVCNLEVSSAESAQLCLNRQIGAEALIREVSIYNGSGTACLEQITSYTKLKRMVAYYNHNKTDDNLNKVLSAGQDVAPVLATNKLFDRSGSGVVTQKKVEVMFKLSLSGIFNSSMPFPNMLTEGLTIKIMTEPNIFNVCQRMGSRQVGRLLDVAGANNPNDVRPLFQRCPGLSGDMCYQVALFNNDPQNPTDPTAVATSHILINTKGGVAPNGGTADNDCIQQENFQAIAPSVQNCPFSVGMKINIFKADNLQSIAVKIKSIALTSGRWDLEIEDLQGNSPVNLATVVSGSNQPNAGFQSKVALMDQGNSIGTVTGTAEKPELTISDLHLVVGTVNLDAGEISKLQSAVNSKGGYTYDYMSYSHYGVNITKALVNSLYIPCKLNRTKSIISVYEDVGSIIDGSRDNNLPIIDKDTLPSEYVYKINNLLVPNRPVDLKNYQRIPSKPGRWGSVHLGELEKAIKECGYQVKSLENPAQALAVGRMLAMYGHTFDMNSAKGETRLNYNFSNQTRDLLFHNYVCHIRRLIITPLSTFVEM